MAVSDSEDQFEKLKEVVEDLSSALDFIHGSGEALQDLGADRSDSRFNHAFYLLGEAYAAVECTQDEISKQTHANEEQDH